MTSLTSSLLPPPSATTYTKIGGFLAPVQRLLDELQQCFKGQLEDIELCGPTAPWFLGPEWFENIRKQPLNGHIDRRLQAPPHHVTIRFRFNTTDPKLLNDARHLILQRYPVSTLVKQKLMQTDSEHWSLIGIPGYDFVFVLSSQNLQGSATCNMLSYSILSPKPVQGSREGVDDVAKNIWRDHPEPIYNLMYPFELAMQLIRGFQPVDLFKPEWLQNYAYDLMRINRFREDYLDTPEEKYYFVLQLCFLLLAANRKKEAAELHQAFQPDSNISLLKACFGLAAWRFTQKTGWVFFPCVEGTGLWINVSPIKHLERLLTPPPLPSFWEYFSSHPSPQIDREGAIKLYRLLKGSPTDEQVRLFAIGFIPASLIEELLKQPTTERASYWLLTLAKQPKICHGTIALEIWRQEKYTPPSVEDQLVECLTIHHPSLARQMMMSPPPRGAQLTRWLPLFPLATILEWLEKGSFDRCFHPLFKQVMDRIIRVESWNEAADFIGKFVPLLKDPRMREHLYLQFLHASLERSEPDFTKHYKALEPQVKNHARFPSLLLSAMDRYPDSVAEWAVRRLVISKNPTALFRKWVFQSPELSLSIASTVDLTTIFSWLEGRCDHRFHRLFKQLMERIVQAKAWREGANFVAKSIPLLENPRMREHLYLQFLHALLECPESDFERHYTSLESQLKTHARLPSLLFAAMNRYPNSAKWALKLQQVAEGSVYQEAQQDALQLLEGTYDLLSPKYQFRVLKRKAALAIQEKDAKFALSIFDQMSLHPYVRIGFEPALLQGFHQAFPSQTIADRVLTFLSLTGWEEDYLSLLKDYRLLPSHIPDSSFLELIADRVANERPIEEGAWQRILAYLQVVKDLPERAESTMRAFFSSPSQALLQREPRSNLLYRLLDSCPAQQVSFWVGLMLQEKLPIDDPLLSKLAQRLISGYPKGLAKLHLLCPLKTSLLTSLTGFSSSIPAARFMAAQLDAVEDFVEWEKMLQECLANTDKAVLGFCKASLQKRKNQVEKASYHQKIEHLFHHKVPFSSSELAELMKADPSLPLYSVILERLLSSKLERETLLDCWILFRENASSFFKSHPQDYLNVHIHFLLQFLKQFADLEESPSYSFIMEQLTLLIVLLHLPSPYKEQHLLVPTDHLVETSFMKSKKNWSSNQALLSEQDRKHLTTLAEIILINLPISPGDAIEPALVLFSKTVKHLHVSPKSLYTWLQKLRLVTHPFMLDMRAALLTKVLSLERGREELAFLVDQLSQPGFQIRLRTLVRLEEALKTIPQLGNVYVTPIRGCIERVIGAMIAHELGQLDFLKALITRYGANFHQIRKKEDGMTLVSICRQMNGYLEGPSPSEKMLALAQHLGDQIIDAFPLPGEGKSLNICYEVLIDVIPLLHALATHLLRHNVLLTKKFYKNNTICRLIFPVQKLNESIDICLLIKEQKVNTIVNNHEQLKERWEMAVQHCLELNNSASLELLNWLFTYAQPTKFTHRVPDLEQLNLYRQYWLHQRAFFEATPTIPAEFVKAMEARFTTFCACLGPEVTKQFFPLYTNPNK